MASREGCALRVDSSALLMPQYVLPERSKTDPADAKKGMVFCASMTCALVMLKCAVKSLVLYPC